MRDYGHTSIANVSYRLELGSYTDTSQFKLAYLGKFGSISKEKFPDGSVHYYMGPFHTLSDASQFKDDMAKKSPEAANSVIMVFYFGTPKTVEEFFDEPCSPSLPQNLSAFVGKNLRDTSVYNQVVRIAGDVCKDSLTFTVQIAAYRHPDNYKYKNLLDLVPPNPIVLGYPDGITRFTLRKFKSLKKAELFRQLVIKHGTRDAWITAIYKGKRVLLEELIASNFYTNAVN